MHALFSDEFAGGVKYPNLRLLRLDSEQGHLVITAPDR